MVPAPRAWVAMELATSRVDVDNPAADGDNGQATSIDGFSGDWSITKTNADQNANVCMAALTPQQINDRLSLRWSVQITPVTLYAAINLSLAFGSEYSGLVTQSEIWRAVFLGASAFAFSESLYLTFHNGCTAMSTCYVRGFPELLRNNSICWCAVTNAMAQMSYIQRDADLGRIPDWRMKEFVRDCDLTTSDNLFFIAFFATMIQIGMAFYAMSSLSLIGYFSGAIVAIFMICSNKTLRLPDHCATPQAFAA